jgi:hypothetical protein
MACALFIGVSGASAQDAQQDERLGPMSVHYQRLAQAYSENDTAMILAYRTPDFYVETPGGDRLDRDVTTQILVDFFTQNAPPIELGTVVACARMNGDAEALFTVVQTTTRNSDLGDGQHRVATAVTQTDTWRLTPEGWRLASISDIHGTRRWVDGVEVDPARPYTANARPFTPANVPAPICESASNGSATH